jgi:hypothetical protein
MVNYALGKIYEITSDQTNKRYIGSTTNKYLSIRFGIHKAEYKQYLKGKSNYVTSYEIIKNPDAKISLLETFPCTNKDELRKREQEWIDENRDTVVNRFDSYNNLSKKEYNNICVKKHYEANKEKIKQKRRARYQKQKLIANI